MRRFHSYGPVDCEEHFCVERKDLIKQCTEQLIGKIEKGGHYFTIWAPRQTGKTWLIRQAKKEIESRYPDQFIIGMMSMQGVILEDKDSDDKLLPWIPSLMIDTFDVEPEVPKNWNEWTSFFHKKKGIFKKPVILFIDEFDSLPPKVIDRLVTLFRDMYLKKESYLLHGLALIGVRAVLGVENHRGSPFNIQRSLHVPNFSKEEVEYLFSQYQQESGQKIEPDVVQKVFEYTSGQPGLVGWFGELLTEKYNLGADKPINMDSWKLVIHKASYAEWNNTILNLIKKVKAGYQQEVLQLFGRSDIPFSLDAEWCSYLYLNGVIDSEVHINENKEYIEACRFASPFIQKRLYNALTYDLVGDRLPILALDPLDELLDVFEEAEVNVPALLQRYKAYLIRLKAKGLNPWKEQPRRADLHLTEYVGHFHLYAWLQNAIGRRCVVSPEFPTGNGKVDLHLRCGEKRGIIEVKSFTDASEVKNSKVQAVGYAKKIGINAVTVALFTPVEDEEVLKKFYSEDIIDGVKVTVVAIGWV